MEPQHISCSEPTPLHLLGRIGRHCAVAVKDESVHPTGTFKDRLAAAAVSGLSGNVLFGSISYGNTAISFARACQHVSGARFVGFFPIGFQDWILGPSSTGCIATGRDVAVAVKAEGGVVIEIDLSSGVIDDSDLVLAAQQRGILSGMEFVNVTEGLKTPSYGIIASEALEQMGEAPDVCIVQYGAGILANELKDVFKHASPKTVVVPISTPQPQSIAKMLYGPIWLDAIALAKHGESLSRHRSPDRTGIRRDPYPVFAIGEDDIRRGLQVAADAQLSAEPSGAAGLGFLDKLDSAVPGYNPGRHRVLVINTGNGIDKLAQRGGTT